MPIIFKTFGPEIVPKLRHFLLEEDIAKLYNAAVLYNFDFALVACKCGCMYFM